MIDLKDLRERPDIYRQGAAAKQYDATLVDNVLDADATLRPLMTRQQELAAEKNQIGKQIGQLAGKLKKASDDERDALQEQMKSLQARPNAIKQEEAELTEQVRTLTAKRDALLLELPQPADDDVPVGKTADDNVQISRWSPDWFDPAKTFEQNKGFAPRSHIELMTDLGMVDFARGTKIAGARSYVLTGPGMLLHQAVLRYAFDMMVHENGFIPVSVADLVLHKMMVGTGFFPHGRDQVYDIANPTAAGDDGEHGLALTGTGEVGLMGLLSDEILEADSLPRTLVTVSTCFRREAGAAGKDTAGLYRVHQFDKVEQVVICQADEHESRAWHKKMMSFVQTLLTRLELPHRLLQCCTGDLGPKNADMVDIECWMPGRVAEGKTAADDDAAYTGDRSGTPSGGWGETHSASRLYDFQCRRLGIRYRDPETGKPVVAHSLNNTVAACPRLLIPIVEMYQNADGSIDVPQVLVPHMNDQKRIICES